MTCHSRGVSPSLSWPSPTTGAEERDPALPSRQDLVLIRLHLYLWVGLVWASEAHCSFSEAGVCPGADQGHYRPTAPLIGITNFRGQHDQWEDKCRECEMFVYSVSAVGPASRTQRCSIHILTEGISE